LLKRLQHLSVENAFLRERTDHLETSVQSLSAELRDRKALLHHVYVVARRTVDPRATPAEPDVIRDFSDWAMPGFAAFLGDETRRRDREAWPRLRAAFPARSGA